MAPVRQASDEIPAIAPRHHGPTVVIMDIGEEEARIWDQVAQTRERQRTRETQARLTVRLIDRSRRVDEFDMTLVEDQRRQISIQASCTGYELAARVGGGPDPHAVGDAAERVAAMLAEDGTAVGSEVVEGGWLVTVRVDQRVATSSAARPSLAIAA